jgi:hypothetical protein
MNSKLHELLCVGRYVQSVVAAPLSAVVGRPVIVLCPNYMLAIVRVGMVSCGIEWNINSWYSNYKQAVLLGQLPLHATAHRGGVLLTDTYPPKLSPAMEAPVEAPACSLLGKGRRCRALRQASGLVRHTASIIQQHTRTGTACVCVCLHYSQSPPTLTAHRTASATLS